MSAVRRACPNLTPSPTPAGPATNGPTARTAPALGGPDGHRSARGGDPAAVPSVCLRPDESQRRRHQSRSTTIVRKESA